MKGSSGGGGERRRGEGRWLDYVTGTAVVVDIRVEESGGGGGGSRHHRQGVN